MKIARQGEAPHGIIIPTDFQYPQERKCVTLAYPEFNNWGIKKVDETDWYLHYDEQYIYTKSHFDKD